MLYDHQPRELEQAKDTQNIRIADVFVLAPALIYAGSKVKTTPLTRSILILAGVATLIYNAKNYWKNAKKIE